METYKKRRSVVRSGFTRAARQMTDILQQKDPDYVTAEATFDLLTEKADALKVLDTDIMQSMVDGNAEETTMEEECIASDEYKFNYMKLRSLYKVFMVRQDAAEATLNSSQTEISERKFRLPRIELKKFGGDVREWLAFWSQFKNVHEDENLAAVDKFQYLISTMIPGSRAKDVVDSFPPTEQNYQKAIDCLKSRFGRDDMLVEVYVRELLKIVLNNVMSSNVKLSTLYDKLETQLRALETLGVTTDTCAAMLFPLVESSLPEELLRAWQRSADYTRKPDASLKTRLNCLMEFLKTEAEGEERIALAVEGFGMDNKIKRTRQKPEDSRQFTAAGLMNNAAGSKCSFCDGNHDSDKCFKAQKMTLYDKKKALSARRACFRCAQVGHLSRKCRTKLKCVLCGDQHIILMCPDLNKSLPVPSNNDQSPNQKTEVSMANYSNVHVFLQTLVLKVRSNAGEKKIRAIIDTGSQRSYVLSSIANEMKWKPKRTERIVHSLFGGARTKVQQHSCYDVRLVSLDGEFACKFEAFDQPVICAGISNVFNGVWIKQLNEIGINLSDTGSVEDISLLIGADVAGKMFTGKKHELKCGLVALETLLGWVLMGKVPTAQRSGNTSMTVTSLLTKDASISTLLQLDVLGITDPGDRKSKIEMENDIKRMFSETVTMIDDKRYEVHLPWKEGHPPLPSNYIIAKNRLPHVDRKLRLSGDFMRYAKVFCQWLSEGIIEHVPEDEVDSPGHYLPHRPVFKETSATTKVRPVFDASAREKNKPSLNDCLEKGINLIELIPSVLLRFRSERIGITSDIRKAFLQISLNKKDRDFLRFLLKTENGEEKIYRHRRVVFGVNSSPFLLGATIEHHLGKYGQDGERNDVYSQATVKRLAKGFYVDNCVTSVPDLDTKNLFIKEATSLMSEGGFDLTMWECSGEGQPETNDVVPLLGLAWNKVRDVLVVSPTEQPLNDTITKRYMLSCAQRIFDPIGVTCPTTLYPKLILQDMWKRDIGWDTEVDEETTKEFRKWTNELTYIFRIEVPRWIKTGTDESQHMSLHTFCDASGVAYATVSFLRVETNTGVEVHLIQAKSRVAPIKKISIPGLELLAASIGARLCTRILEAMNATIDSYLWTDSTTVLSWIRRREEWSTFVWNRVKEIKELTSVQSWRHIPGEQNPADLPSRGCSPKHLYESKWWEGPRWLFKHPTEWPSANKDEDHNEYEINTERKKKLVTMVSVCKTECFYQYFSKYRRTVRLVAWILRFVQNSGNPEDKTTGDLNSDEEERAEKKLIYIIQQESFSEKDGRLSAMKVVRNEDGILMLESRVAAREDLDTFRYPYLLPGKHELVERLIFDHHIKSGHVGLNILMNQLRERFWILGGRRSIRAAIRSCVVCKRQSAKRAEEQSPPLPLDRVRDAACFEITGVDLAGPLYLRDGRKIWICLFTCAVYRAIHLEMVDSLSTSTFLRALRRFIARRGRPRIIYSDNGTNFVGAENLLSQVSPPPRGSVGVSILLRLHGGEDGGSVS